MKVIILAAGYATRLHPLTLTRAKPLLDVAGQPMIDHVLGHVGAIDGIDRYFVVTNARFAAQFQQWADDYRAKKPPLNLDSLVRSGSAKPAKRRNDAGSEL